MGKKYYWLKLKEDFFEQDSIDWLEEQENGKEYCLFYLKLCLKSLKTNGILIRTVGQMLIPYDAKKLSEITNTDFDTVVVAMKLLEQIGLIQILASGEIFLTELEQMVGSETKWAEKKRIQRQKEDIVPSLSLESPTEIEKEIDIYKEIKNNNTEQKDCCCSIPELTEKEYQKLLSLANNDNNKIMEKYNIAKKQNVRNLMGWLIKALENDYKDVESKKKQVHNFEQRSYDYTELNKMLYGK